MKTKYFSDYNSGIAKQLFKYGKLGKLTFTQAFMNKMFRYFDKMKYGVEKVTKEQEMIEELCSKINQTIHSEEPDFANIQKEINEYEQKHTKKWEMFKQNEFNNIDEEILFDNHSLS